MPRRITRSKYGAVPTIVDNVRFASKREATRYSHLKLLEQQGIIRGLIWDKKDLRWPLEVNGTLICTYEADFFYECQSDNGDWCEITEDAKGFKTPAYRLKKKLMKAIHNIDIQEI